MTAIAIRPEEPGDEAAIHALTQAAFRDMPFSDGSEPELLGRLRADGDLALSLVAVNIDEAIVGHIAFSPVSIADGSAGWFQLSPVSVIPSGQRSGIGSALILRGLADLRASGAKGCVLLGDPEYYGRFGFEHDPALELPGYPPSAFQRLVFEGDPPTGRVSLPPAYSLAE